MVVNTEALALLIEEHMPFEGAGGGEPGDAGCQCDEKFPPPYFFTWRGYCDHLANVIAKHLTTKGDL